MNKAGVPPTRRGIRGLVTLLTVLMLGAAGCANQTPQADPGQEAQSAADRVPPHATPDSADPTPLTTANLRGHRSLYNEGWFIVTSTRDALDYAHRYSVQNSGEALAAARADVAGRTTVVTSALSADVDAGRRTAASLHQAGTNAGDFLRGGGHAAGEAQVYFGLERLSRSWSYVTGGIYYGPRTSEHWRGLKETWPAYYGDLRSDFSNILELNHRVAAALATNIEADWEGAFAEAAREFHGEYVESGRRGNSISALGDILIGYLKAFYEGIARPTGRSVVLAASEGAQAGSYLFTPTAGFISLTGRTLQSTGLSLYYGTRTGIEILSPTVEAGFLAGLGILSLGSGTATHMGGETLGAVSQVAFSGAGAVAGTVHAGGRMLASTGSYVALVTYDAGKAATQVTINQARSGVVLGYNALTAIPAHLLIGVPSAAIFLAYEGPKLVLVRAQEQRDESAPDEPGVAHLPVGAVVDLEALKQAEGVTVEVITDDPAVTGAVLESAKEDLEVERTR